MEKYKFFYGSCDQLSNGVILMVKVINMYDVVVELDFKFLFWNLFLWLMGYVNMLFIFFQICGVDFFCDEVLIYERELWKEYGVNIKVVVYQGLFYVFWYNYFIYLQVEKYYVDVVCGIGWFFGKEMQNWNFIE